MATEGITLTDSAEADLTLPYRTLSPTANLREYTTSNPEGHIPHTVASNTGHRERYKLVTFTPSDPENPKNWSKAFKWWCTMNIALVTFAVAFANAVITPGIVAVAEDLRTS